MIRDSVAQWGNAGSVGAFMLGKVGAEGRDFCLANFYLHLTLHVYKLVALYISVSIQTMTVPATIPIINVS